MPGWGNTGYGGTEEGWGGVPSDEPLTVVDTLKVVGYKAVLDATTPMIPAGYKAVES